MLWLIRFRICRMSASAESGQDPALLNALSARAEAAHAASRMRRSSRLAPNFPTPPERGCGHTQVPRTMRTKRPFVRERIPDRRHPSGAGIHCGDGLLQTLGEIPELARLPVQKSNTDFERQGVPIQLETCPGLNEHTVGPDRCKENIEVLLAEPRRHKHPVVTARLPIRRFRCPRP